MTAKEERVSYEVAREMHRLGYESKIVCWDESTNDWICHPSLWEAQKWLREKHNISVEPYATGSGWKWSICKACKDGTGGTYIIGSIEKRDEESCKNCGSYTSYESALNGGIKEALKRL